MSGPRARLSLLDRAWAEIVGPRGGQATETGSRGSGRARFGVWRGAVVLSLRPLSIDQRDGSYPTWARPRRSSGAAELRVGGAIDLAHAALADEGGDVVMAEADTSLQGHQFVLILNRA